MDSLELPQFGLLLILYIRVYRNALWTARSFLWRYLHRIGMPECLPRFLGRSHKESLLCTCPRFPLGLSLHSMRFLEFVYSIMLNNVQWCDPVIKYSWKMHVRIYIDHQFWMFCFFFFSFTGCQPGTRHQSKNFNHVMWTFLLFWPIDESLVPFAPNLKHFSDLTHFETPTSVASCIHRRRREPRRLALAHLLVSPVDCSTW